MQGRRGRAGGEVGSGSTAAGIERGRAAGRERIVGARCGTAVSGAADEATGRDARVEAFGGETVVPHVGANRSHEGLRPRSGFTRGVNGSSFIFLGVGINVNNNFINFVELNKHLTYRITSS